MKAYSILVTIVSVWLGYIAISETSKNASLQAESDSTMLIVMSTITPINFNLIKMELDEPGKGVEASIEFFSETLVAYRAEIDKVKSKYPDLDMKFYEDDLNDFTIKMNQLNQSGDDNSE